MTNDRWWSRPIVIARSTSYPPWNQHSTGRRPLQKETHLPTPVFQVQAVSFREGTTTPLLYSFLLLYLKIPLVPCPPFNIVASFMTSMGPVHRFNREVPLIATLEFGKKFAKKPKSLQKIHSQQLGVGRFCLLSVVVTGKTHTRGCRWCHHFFGGVWDTSIGRPIGSI